MKNRIKKLREARGLSQAALGKLCGTTSATIQRLETGERQLTEKWMREIAKELGVRPVDLISAMTIADFSDEVDPAPYGPASMQKSLQTIGLTSYVVNADSVELAGYPSGSPILINETQQAISSVKTGDIVVATVSELTADSPSYMLVRQFISPKILITNREGANIALNLDSDEFSIKLIGVGVMPDTD